MSRTFTEPAALVAYERSLDCVHCGLCLEHCPTYVQTGRESAGPRGRIYLMRALMEGRAEASPDLVQDLDLCLVCRACESACPSGVRYGEMIAFTRSEVRRPGRLRRWMLASVGRPRRLRALAALLRLYQRSPLRFAGRLLPRRLRMLEANLPPVPPARARDPLPRENPARAPRRGRVAFLEGCVMGLLFPDVNRDAVRLLQAAGFDVAVPEGQTCCGALHEHDGDLETARAFARRNVQAFAAAGASHVVMDSAGCGAAFQGYGHLLDDEAARALAARTVDVARFLADHGDALRFRPTSPADGPVTYDAPCHLHHAQKETAGPLPLLARIEGLRFVPLPRAESCCGAAGIYNLDQPAMADALLDAKLDALAATGARTLLTGNPGCLLQWRKGVARRGLDVQVLHPVTFLARLLDG